MLIDKGNHNKKMEHYLYHNGQNRVSPEADRRTDIINYRVASLLKMLIFTA